MLKPQQKLSHEALRLTKTLDCIFLEFRKHLKIQISPNLHQHDPIIEQQQQQTYFPSEPEHNQAVLDNLDAAWK
jgi:hypothetical protein